MINITHGDNSHKITVIEGKIAASEPIKVAIIAARFNNFISDRLLEGAIDALRRHGGLQEHQIDVFKVPGAAELPIAAKKILDPTRGIKYAGVIALGAIIRGSTAHFELIAHECLKGLNQVALDTEVPIASGVLATENIEQAIERAGTKTGNKGAEAAVTILEMISLFEQI